MSQAKRFPFISLLVGAVCFGVEKPNVVIILTDDLGYGDVSVYNPEGKIQTPRMDALAAEGVWCVDAHTTSGICSPSRYSVLTGRYPWRGKLKHGIVSVFEESTIKEGLYCLPQLLKDQGYQTACIGKWHLGFEWPWRNPDQLPSPYSRRDLQPDAFDWSKPITGGPWAIGFEHYFGDDVPNFAPYAFIEDGYLTCDPIYVTRDQFTSVGKMGGLRGDGPGQAGWQLDEVMPEITKRAVDYVNQKSREDVPFFLYFSTTSPHTPVVPTPEFQGSSECGSYGDYVVQTDDAVGQVIAALKANDCFENTLIFVTSDNGPCYYSVDENRERGQLSSGGFRGMKAETWEGGHRVPFIVSWPDGGLSGGRQSDVLVSLVDIFATVAEVLEVELPNDCAQDSFPVLASLKSDASVRTEMVYLNGAGFMGLRQNDWVLIEGPAGRSESMQARKDGMSPSSELSKQLFNLHLDPAQEKDVAPAYPEKIAEMGDRLEQLRNGERTR